MTSRNVVRVRDLHKSYGSRTVVDGVDLDVGTGEIVGIIGANGAGKTTTVECIQGLRRPDTGTIRVLGLDPVADHDRLRGMVGSQLQSSALPDRLRVGEAVRLFADGDRDDLLSQFGLDDLRSSPFASLSGGERQRLFLVLALLNHPRLVILDELTQGLDATARRDVWTAVDQLRNDDTAVLLVTHELDEAEHLCDRVLAMRAGRVLDSGPPAQLVDRYGPVTSLTFTAAAGLGVDVTALGVLPGVSDVAMDGDRVVVRGDRRAIAHVGAAFVQTGWVPPDLSVHVPTLDDALVGLLQHNDEELKTELTKPELVGAAL